jgi:hypothetical protein
VAERVLATDSYSKGVEAIPSPDVENRLVCEDFGKVQPGQRLEVVENPGGDDSVTQINPVIPADPPYLVEQFLTIHPPSPPLVYAVACRLPVDDLAPAI